MAGIHRMKNPYMEKLVNTLPFIIMGRQNPVSGGLLYLITNKSTAWFVLRFMVLGAFIVLVNAALEWSNHNTMEAIIIAGGIIVFILLLLFVVKNKRATVFLMFLFGVITESGV